MKSIVVELSWLDVFFIGTTLLSLAWNLYQFVDRRKSYLPVKNSLRKGMKMWEARQLGTAPSANPPLAPPAEETNP